MDSHRSTVPPHGYSDRLIRIAGHDIGGEPLQNLSDSVREWRGQLPARLEGLLPLPEGETIAERVQRFLTEHARFLFGTAEPDLRLERTQESPGGVHLYFQQYHQGLPVVGARVAVHVDDAGRLLLLTSQFRRDEFMSGGWLR